MDIVKKVHRFCSQNPGNYRDLKDRIASIIWYYQDGCPEDRKMQGLKPKKDWEDLDPGERDECELQAGKIIERLLVDGLLRFDTGKK